MFTYAQKPTTVTDTSKTNSKISPIVKDSTKKDSVAIPKSQIETTINYSATDSIQMDAVNRIVYLFGNAKITYGNISLEAARIEINWNTNVMTAYPATDSTGKKIGVPVFKEGNDVFVVDTIRYNSKTKKGIIKGVVTKQGEGYLHGEKVKKVEDNLYISSAKYTTCDLAHPHFYIKARKLKVIPQDKIVSGPFNIYIADVPTPAGFFLGYFPMPKRKKSGVIIPTFGSTATRGFFLRQGGYYWAASDYLGVQALGDYYTNGSYRANVTGTYRKRYGFQGAVSVSTSQTRYTFDPSESPFRDFNFAWQHSTLGKRNSNLTANVNILSNGYYKRNSYNPTTFQQGNFSSTVIYYKTFANTPFNINVALRQDQNIRTRVMNLTLPEVTLNMNRIYPFKNSTFAKGAVGSSFLSNFYVQYSSNAKIFITNDSTKTGYDTTYAFNAQNLNRLLSKAQYGARHSVPIGTTIKLRKTFLKYFNFSPTATFEEWMYPYKYTYTNATKTSIQPVQTKVYQFTNFYDWFLNLSVNTNIYGMYSFKSKKLLGIRHTFNPIIAYQYRPDFTTYNYQRNVILDTNNRVGNLPLYPGLYGGPSSLTANILTFTLNNTVEAKATSKKDTITGIKKFKLIDQLIISGFYNFSDTAQKLSRINVQGRSRILNRIDVFGSGIFDPYAYNGISGVGFVRTKEFAINKHQGLAKLISYNLSVGFNFNKTAKSPRPYTSNKGTKEDLAAINAHPEMYVDFNIPWNLTINYNLNYSKSFTTAPNFITQSITFVGDVRITEKWKIVFNSGYDIQNKALTTTRVDIYRDLHCWQMALNIVPIGINRSYGFTINAKSSILQDLKLSKRNSNYFGSNLY
jgi:lipopolysaccharide assembly outer membrane protein LptD (OstA)